MCIHNHKGAIKNSTQKLKMKKKEITKLLRQNTSHLEEKKRLGHEISWLTDKLNQRNKSDDETTVYYNAGDTDNSATCTTVLYKKHSATTKGKKPRKKPTKTKQPQSCRPSTTSTPVLTDNAVTTRPKTEVAILRKSATPRSTLDHTKATKVKDEGDKTQGETTLKGLAQAKIIKTSVILFRVLNMTIWCKHVHRLELQIFIIFVLPIHQLG